MMPDRSHDDRVPDLPQNPTALFQKFRNKTFASTLHIVDVTSFGSRCWLRGGRFAILTGARNNARDKVNYRLRPPFRRQVGLLGSHTGILTGAMFR